MTNEKKIQWLLRIAVFSVFLGHGVFAIKVNPSWIGYLMTVGFSSEQARMIMPYIGILDVIVALHVLLRPTRYILIWATFWAIATATIRPLSGELIWSFVERGANWITPLVLYMLLFIKKKK